MIFQYILESCEEIKDYFNHEFEVSDLQIDQINRQRTNAFKLQAFGRLIRRSYKKTNLKKAPIGQIGSKIKLSAKFIEDSIGDYLYHYEMKAVSASPEKLMSAAKRLESKASDFSSSIEVIKQNFSQLETNELRRLYLKGFVREIKKIQKDVEKIDPKLLEDGTHELRRKLRWIIMYVLYPKGLFSYKEAHPKVSKYTKLYPNEEFQPVQISFWIMNELSRFVYELGQIKDKGLSKNYNKPHSFINESEAITIEKTTKVLDYLFQNNPLEALRAEVKKALG